jgi:hypothetical protein
MGPTAMRGPFLSLSAHSVKRAARPVEGIGRKTPSQFARRSKHAWE